MNYKTKLVLATATLSGALLFSQVNVKADTYTLQSGDSFYSVAQMYGLSVYDLAALNGMSIYDTIVPGQVLQIPDKTPIDPFVTNLLTSSRNSESAQADVPAVKSENSTNTYPVGQCTWGVKQVATWASNWWGNAGDWAANAASQGYVVGTQAEVGAIVCWTDPDSYGHVAYVTAVNASGQIQVLESNYGNKQWIDNYRGWFDPTKSNTAGTVSYIYPESY